MFPPISSLHPAVLGLYSNSSATSCDTDHSTTQERRNCTTAVVWARVTGLAFGNFVKLTLPVLVED